MKSTEMKSITNKLLESFNYNKIVLKRSLGKGAFGQCFEIDWQENSSNDIIKMALKFIPGGIYDTKKDLFNREISIHQNMCNKYIVKLHKVNIDPISGDVHMIMELCYNRSLADFINQNGSSGLKPIHMNRICNGICRGLMYLHDDQGIVHRDIKPANILLNEKMSPKISDFGLATTPEQCQLTKHKICGTPHYLAPEIFQQYGHSFQSDIWAFGVTLYFMIAGYTPFETQQQRDGINKSNSLQQTISLVYQNVIRGKYRFPKNAPPCSKRFIKGILQKDPQKRPHLNDLLEYTFYPTKSIYPETPEDEHCDHSMGFQLSMESIVFISDQPIIDAINNLSERMHSIPQKIEEIIWVTRWAMKTLFQFYYTLNNESIGGNIQNLKGIVITIDKKETHFQQEDQTINSGLTKKFEELTSSNIAYYSDLIIKMLRPFNIPQTILISLLSTLKSKAPNKSNPQNSNIFVYKWFFYCESVIFLLSNGCWQISFNDHSKLFIVDKVAVVFDGKSENYEIVSVEDWCAKNTSYMDIMRTLIYSIL